MFLIFRCPSEPNEPAIDEKGSENLGFEAGLENPVLLEPLKLTPAQLLGGPLGQKSQNVRLRTNSHKDLVIITSNTGLASISRARAEMLRQWNQTACTKAPEGLVLDATTYETLLDDVNTGHLEEDTESRVTRL